MVISPKIMTMFVLVAVSQATCGACRAGARQDQASRFVPAPLLTWRVRATQALLARCECTQGGTNTLKPQLAFKCPASELPEAAVLTPKAQQGRPTLA